MKKIYKVSFIILLILLAVVSLKKGLENKVDPLWKSTEKLIGLQTFMLDENSKQLQKVFDSIHPQQKNINALHFISKPFLPSLSWKEFEKLLFKVLKEKKVVINGTSGTGKTTVIDRVSLIIAGSKEQVIRVSCSEGLEQDYNKQFVGYYDKTGFHPGELLTLFNKCDANPKKNYVLIIDDFDKIHRSTFFGAAIWNELDIEGYDNYIKGYNKQITIPKNLFLISAIQPGNLSNIPFSAEDYRRLTNGNPVFLRPDIIQLKEYILKGKEQPITNTTTKDSLIKQLYFFQKTNQIIEQRISKSAIVGQWSGITKPIKKFDFKSSEDFVKSHLSKFQYLGKLTEEDFEHIRYSLNSAGKLKNSNFLATAFKNLMELGLFSELSVAILFALLSAIGLRRNYIIKKRNLDKFLDKIRDTETKYYNNTIVYHQAFGSLLSIKDDIHHISKKGKLNFSQANYLISILEENLKVIDFVHVLGGKHEDLQDFMKTVISDDDITQEEFDEHIQFLKLKKNEIDNKTYYTVKQQLIKLFYKSKVKHGRIKV